MRLKLFKKYFFINVSIVAVSLLVIMMILSLVLNNHITKAAYSTLNETCNQIDNNFENFEDSDSFFNIAVPLSKVSNSEIFLTDNHGTVLICACQEWQENEKCMHSSYIMPKHIIDRSRTKTTSEINNLGIYKMPHYVSVKAIGDQSKYYVFASMPVRETHAIMRRISKVYYLWAIVPLLFMLVAIYLITYRLTKPLKSMSEAAKAMAKGDFSKRVPVTSDDEIGELAVSFNMMTNSLSRLESMRRSFVGNVSHELKTPMTTIGGFIDGILDGTIKQEEHKHYLGIVSKEVKRLSRLVNNMLSIARLESEEFSLKLERFDFYNLLCTIMISQEKRIEEHKLDIMGLDTLDKVTVYCDKDLIYQVVYNLVDNAIKFTDNGGISISSNIIKLGFNNFI